MLAWEDIQRILKKHDFSRTEPAATPYEGLILGNADMGSVVFGPACKLTFRVNKMDLWDGRMNVENLQPVLPLSRFKELVFSESMKLKKGEAVRQVLDKQWEGEGTIYPCMRTGFDFTLRVTPSEQTYPVLKFSQSVRLEDGVYRADFPVVWWPGYPGVGAEAFIHWEYNLLAVRLKIPDCSSRFDLNRLVTMSVWRDPYGGRTWENLSAGPSLGKNGIGHWRRDPRANALPPADYRMDGNLAVIRQVIPGDSHCPERSFTGAVLCREGGEFLREPSGQVIMECASVKANEITVFASIASDMEGPGAGERAVATVKEACSKGWDRLYSEHADLWKNFWMESAVALEDAYLERKAVRTNYGLAITARSGRPAPGLVGCATPNDCPPWRGDRHNDYPEFSSYFWGAFSANHQQQALNYTEFVYGYLPTARRIAREVYECDRGAAYPCTYHDGSDLYSFHPTWSRILWLTAVHAQNCWWHYQYFGDRKFLAGYAYPVMRECADFYVELVKKNPPGDYTFWPTIATEIRGWTKDFELNKNCIEDLAHIKFLMRAVVEASELLGTDGDARKQWRDILDHLPAYPLLNINNREEFVDFAGQTERPRYNHSVPLAPLWPAEDPDVINDPRLREAAKNTLFVHPWDSVRLVMALMRLEMHEEVHQRMFGKDVREADETSLFFRGGDSLLVTEMLVTAWDGILRVFPCWPLEKKAVFHQLRTKGAFLVSASCGGGKVEEVTIKSDAGNPVAMRAPWKDTMVVDEAGNRVAVEKAGAEILRWQTETGKTYRLKKGGGN